MGFFQLTPGGIAPTSAGLGTFMDAAQQQLMAEQNYCDHLRMELDRALASPEAQHYPALYAAMGPTSPPPPPPLELISPESRLNVMERDRATAEIWRRGQGPLPQEVFPPTIGALEHLRPVIGLAR